MPDSMKTTGRATMVDPELVAAIEKAKRHFREVAAAWGDLEKFARINKKYALEMDFDSVPGLCERFGLTFPSI